MNENGSTVAIGGFSYPVESVVSGDHQLAQVIRLLTDLLYEYRALNAHLVSIETRIDKALPFKFRKG